MKFMEYIKVKAKEGFVLRNKKEKILAEIKEGEIFKAKLHDSDEYFAKDKQGREFCVGELDFNGILKLDECFELSNVISLKRKEGNKMEEKIKRIKEYLEECVRLYEQGVHYYAPLIACDINKILESQEDELVKVGSFLEDKYI